MPAPVLDRLTSGERGYLLGALLAAHPELAAEAECLALSQLAAVDAEAVAEAIEWSLREADAEQLDYRAGRVRGRGYVHVNEAATGIVEELLQPELDDLIRRAALGLHDAARQIAIGLLRGLANCQIDVEVGTVRAYAGPDVTDDLVRSVRDTLAKADLDLTPRPAIASNRPMSLGNARFAPKRAARAGMGNRGP
ncbi:MAG: hypothetical protein QOG97_611 [Acidimicrobiaceae bacterium]|nr:hypothetical protein [Acidimicrobiaceae bacterium]